MSECTTYAGKGMAFLMAATVALTGCSLQARTVTNPRNPSPELVEAEVAEPETGARTEEGPAESAFEDESTPSKIRCAQNNTVTAKVVALDQALSLNRWGASMPGGMIYALASDVFPSSETDQSFGNSCEVAECKSGEVSLRKNKRPRPITLRVSEGQCLRIQFTNLLSANAIGTQPTTRATSIHVQGMSWATGPEDDGSYVGANDTSLAQPGKTKNYTLIAEHEGSYVLYGTGDDWNALGGGGGDGGTLAEGLFGAVNVEPSGLSTGQSWVSEFYRSQVTELDLCLASSGRYAASPPGLGTCKWPTTSTGLPIVNYSAVYPKGHPYEGQPILSMLCTAGNRSEAKRQGLPECTQNQLYHSDVTAIITGPGAKSFPGSYGDIGDLAPDLRPNYSYPKRLQPYRELTTIYHETFQATQAFQAQYTATPSIKAAEDAFGINYGFGGLATELVANRLKAGALAGCTDCKYEEFFLVSWAMGDPAMPTSTPTDSLCSSTCSVSGAACTSIGNACPDTGGTCGWTCKQAPDNRALYPDDPSNVYHSYMGDHLKFRVVHGGSDLHHIHHQHAHQWLGEPNSPNGDYLDSQTIGPGSTFSLEMVYNGSGNVNQTVGDSIFHCHFYPHFASGMWSLWRVHDVFEAGTHLAPDGAPAQSSRALPDYEIKRGTPIPAVVPMPTYAMAPAPAPVRISADHTKYEVCVGPTADPTCAEGRWIGPQDARPMPAAYSAKKPPPNPGYPFYIPGIAGSRAPHPPGDFAWSYSCPEKSDFEGSVCRPAVFGVADKMPDQTGCTCNVKLDGGLPRNVFESGKGTSDYAGSTTGTAPVNYDWSKEVTSAVAHQLPESGTLLEKIAMDTHALRQHPTQFPDGTSTGANFILNGLDPVQGAPFADPCIDFSLDVLPGNKAKPAQGAVEQRYLAADIQLDAIFNKEGWHFPQQRMISLWGDVKDYLKGVKPPEPLFMRLDSSDCATYVLANLVPNVYELDDFQVRTPTDIIGQHIHLVKFDVTSSDGASNGWNYEDGTFGPNEVTERIDAVNAKGGKINAPFGKCAIPEYKTEGTCANYPTQTCTNDAQCQAFQLTARYIPFFGPGPGGAWQGSQATVQRWYDDPLFNNIGRCSQSGKFCTTFYPSAGQCGASETCLGVEDRTLRTVFTHDHYGPSTHQQAGLYAGVVVEPTDSRWLDNETGEQFGGYDPTQSSGVFPSRVSTGYKQHKVRDGGPTSWQAVIRTGGKCVKTPTGGWCENNTGRCRTDSDCADDSFREFLLEFQDSTLTYLPFTGIEPWEHKSACSDNLGTECDPSDDAKTIAATCGAENTCQRVGFCSFTGVCADGSRCLIAPPGGTASKCPDQSTCTWDASTLAHCTPDDMTQCASEGKEVAGTLESCNYVTGIPGSTWGTKATGTRAIDSPGSTPEAITFAGATNNFSVNYRNEPLFMRTTDSTGKPLDGNAGDMSWAYASIERKGAQSHYTCPNGPNRCFYQDGTRVPDQKISECGQRGKAACYPYPPLTPDVGPNDPFTPMLRAYAGDDVQIRTLVGAHINPHNFTVHGMNWLQEPAFVDSGWRNSMVMSISEHFEEIVRVPPSFSDNKSGSADYLYQVGAAAIEQAGGNWGLIRAYGSTAAGSDKTMWTESDTPLTWLPQNPSPTTASGFCEDMPTRTYDVVALTAEQALGGSGTCDFSGGTCSQQVNVPCTSNDTCSAQKAGVCKSGTCSKPVSVSCTSDATCKAENAGVCDGSCTNNANVTCSSAAPPTTCETLFPYSNSLSGNAWAPSAILFFNATDDPYLADSQDGSCTSDPSQCAKYTAEPEPLVLRAVAGECIQVTLHNNLPATLPATFTGVGAYQTNTKGKSNVSTTLGLHAQLVAYDPLTSDGFNVGANAGSANPTTSQNTATPGGTAQYTWYAGNFEPRADNPYIPIEFGAANLLPSDPINHYLQSAFGGLIIEPPRTHSWEWPRGSGQTAYGSRAWVTYDDVTDSGRTKHFSEFVVFTQDDTNMMGGTGSTKQTIGGINAVNYKTASLFASGPPIGFCKGCSSNDVSCALSEQAYCKDTNKVAGTTAGACVQANQQKTNTNSAPVCIGPNGDCVACPTTNQPAGPIWDNADAQAKCHAVCELVGATWNGSWHTTVEGQASVCSCDTSPGAPQTPMFQACAGDPVRFRFLHPGGTNTNNTIEIYGHSFTYAASMTQAENCIPGLTQTNLYASQFLGNQSLCGSTEWTGAPAQHQPSWNETLAGWSGSLMGHGPTNHYNILLQQAGGRNAVPGDYLYRSYSAFHFNTGIWGVFRVADPAAYPTPAACGQY